MSTPYYDARLDSLRKVMRANDLACVALVPGKNFLYLTDVDLRLMLRPMIALIPVSGQPAMIVPELEQSSMTAAGLDWRYFAYHDSQGHLPAFEAALQFILQSGQQPTSDGNITHIGVEGFKMRVAEGQLIQQYAPSASLIVADDLIGAAFHLYKSADVLDKVRQAIRISESALDETLPQIRVGMTEKQVEAILVARMEAHGSHGNAFAPIVTGGPNTALPHAHAGTRAFAENEFVLIDYGASFERYPADITRTFVLGQPSEEMRRIYEAVLKANEAGIAAARPGATGQDVDRAARAVIEAAGYGQYFNHRTGHGLGLEGHEPPYMREGDLTRLEAGMLFTVEPGVYIEGMGGVRIEDNLVITDSGADVLTSYPKDLRIIG